MLSHTQEKITAETDKLVHHLCNLIVKYNTLTIDTNQNSFRFFTAYFNPIMAGRIGNEMDELKKIKKQLGPVLDTLKKSLDLNNDHHQMVINYIKNVIQTCEKNTISNLKNEGNHFLNDVINFSSRIRHLSAK